MTWCWACDEPRPHGGLCWECGAPPWTNRGNGRAGVYVIEAECGLAKIGMSTLGVYGRVEAIRSASKDPIRHITTLWGAGARVERWLHSVFADTRDPKTARAYELAAPTEWFWPTPALRRLVDGEPFIRHGHVWETADHLLAP